MRFVTMCPVKLFDTVTIDGVVDDFEQEKLWWNKAGEEIGVMANVDVVQLRKIEEGELK